MKNLANILTIIRLVLLPFIVVLFFIPMEWAAWACLTLYIIGALTDYLDGWVARKFNQITDFGTFLDPISDKIFVVTIMLMLVAVGSVSGGWVMGFVIIIMREFLVSGIREFLGPRNVKLPVSKLAKWKTATQMLALGFLIVSPYVFVMYVTGHALLLCATALTVITGWGYLKTGLKHIKA